MLTDGLAALTIFLHLAIAVILVQKYRRTKDVGFIWLGLAVVIWPLVSGVFAVAVQQPLLDRVAHHQAVGFYPLSLVIGQMTLGDIVSSIAWAKQIIGVCLLLMAVLYLSKPRNVDVPC